MYSRKVALSKTIINCSNHGFMPKTYVLTLYHTGNTLFQTIIVNSDDLLVRNILHPPAIFRNWRSHLTSLRILRGVANE
jgi:hypothetical protein